MYYTTIIYIVNNYFQIADKKKPGYAPGSFLGDAVGSALGDGEVQATDTARHIASGLGQLDTVEQLGGGALTLGVETGGVLGGAEHTERDRLGQTGGEGTDTGLDDILGGIEAGGIRVLAVDGDGVGHFDLPLQEWVGVFIIVDLFVLSTTF